MKVNARCFNIILALMVALALPTGCQTDKHKTPLAGLRVHLEVSPDAINTSETISFPRSDPVVITIAKEPVLVEGNVIAARVIEAPGGFAIKIQFDESSSLMLEQYAASNPGKHFVIYGQWGDTPADGRWLATPLITHRIGDGVLSFTPDCSREEADKLVTGLNNVAKKMHGLIVK